MTTDENGPWVEPDEVGVRLLLFGPAEGDADLVTQRVTAALATGLVAAFVADEAMPEELAAMLHGLCRDHEVAFLLRGQPVGVIERGADGVHLDTPEMLLSARRLLGLERLIGAACDLSRHVAMVAGDEGADYVTFGSPDRADPVDELAELVGWWSELFVVPVAAFVSSLPGAADKLVAAGADFLAIGSSLFEAGQEAGSRFQEIVSAAGRAGSGRDRD